MMRRAAAYGDLSVAQVKALLDGGLLKIYSVGRPSGPDAPVERSALLAVFHFAAPAFSDVAPGDAVFAENPVQSAGVGTPGFARAFAADGVTVVADFAAGPGGDITLSQVSTTPGYPVAVTGFAFG